MLKNKGFSSIALIIIAVLILGGGYWVWNVSPPVKFWFTPPTNFAECVEATRGVVIKTSPEQCEFRGQNFVNANGW